MARVLLIDDDPSLLDVLSMALQDAGHQVLTSTSGVRGLSMAADERPDLIVSVVPSPARKGKPRAADPADLARQRHR